LGKFGEDLEVNILKLTNPRLNLLNIPVDITLENVEETFTIQNPELDLKEGDIRAKYCYTTKGGGGKKLGNRSGQWKSKETNTNQN
jgi:hypothetical protein